MKGILFAILGGGFITLQGVANARISQDIGTWQTASITHLTGFLTALLILMILRDQQWKQLKKVKPIYLTGGTFGAIVIFANVTAMHKIGVTLTIAALLISQLCLTFVIDSTGWFEVVKQKMRFQHFLCIGMMIAGVIILRF